MSTCATHASETWLVSRTRLVPHRARAGTSLSSAALPQSRINPLAVTVTHLRDDVYDPNDDIIKATANEARGLPRLRVAHVHEGLCAWSLHHTVAAARP